MKRLAAYIMCRSQSSGMSSRLGNSRPSPLLGSSAHVKQMQLTLYAGILRCKTNKESCQSNIKSSPYTGRVTLLVLTTLAQIGNLGAGVSREAVRWVFLRQTRLFPICSPPVQGS